MYWAVQPSSISLMTNDVECLFKCLLAIRVSLEKSPNFLLIFFLLFVLLLNYTNFSNFKYSSFIRYMICIFLSNGVFCFIWLLFFLFFFFNVYLFLRQRETEHERGRVREGETQNLKQAPGSELSAQSPTRGSNSRTARSWPELKSDA